MEDSDKILFPEFQYLQSFEVDCGLIKYRFDLFKNVSGQYVTVQTDMDHFHRSVMFYRDYEHLTSVFEEDVSEIEMSYWK